MHYNHFKADTSKIEMEYLMNHYAQSVRIEKRELTENMPDLPGVYLMKNMGGEIIYIGKSKNLRKRVQSYFVQSTQHSRKVMKMVCQVKKINYIVTGTELEALLLESKLIKEKLPQYNKQLRNYKSYGYIKITQGESYPRLVGVHQLIDDGDLYYGPYSNYREIQSIIDALRTSVGLRQCNENSNALKPCLYHQIGDCISPCVALNCQQQYDEAVHSIRLFLEGKSEEVIQVLEGKRDRHCEHLRFEKAGELQQKVDCLKRFYNYCKNYIYAIEKRNVVLLLPARTGSSVTVLAILRGRVWNTYHYLLEDLKERAIEVIRDKIALGLMPTDQSVGKKDVDEIMIIGRWLRENQDYPFLFVIEESLNDFERDFSNNLMALQKKTAVHGDKEG